jgi:hypothetical protein
MRLLLVAVALSLEACGQQSYSVSTRDLADDADANARNALAQIDDLQSKVEQLEAENRALAGRVDELESQSADHLTWANSLADKHNTLANDFWRYQKWNEQRFASLGRPWESL